MASPGRMTSRGVLAGVLLMLGGLGSGLSAQQAATLADSTSPPVSRDSALAAPPSPSALDSLRRIGAPVVVRGDTLFRLYAFSGAITPAERAAALVTRIRQVAKRVRAGTDTLTVADVDGQIGVLVGDLVLVAVLPSDVRDSGQTQVSLANRYAEVLREAIDRGSFLNQIRQIAIGLALALLATGLLLLLRWLLQKVFDRLGGWIRLLRGSSRLPTLRIQQLEVLSAERIADALHLAARAVRVAALVILFYFYLVAVLGFFPQTRGASTRILDYVLQPLGVVGRGMIGYLPDLFFLAVIIVVTRYLLRGIHLIFHAIETGAIVLPGFDDDWAIPTYKLARFLVLGFSLVVMWPYLPGSDSEAFKGLSLFVGVLFSLGSTGAVANLVAGTLLTYTRAFQVGDRVRIGETTGDVVARTLMVTRVRTVTNVEVTIPNSMVMGSEVLNFSTNARKGGILIQTTVTIGYDVPWRRVHELLLAAATATEGIAADPPPFVLQTGLNDYYPAYELNGLITDPQAMRRILSELNGNIQDTFAEGGVEITSPAFTAIRDANTSTIPAPHTPAPVGAFRVLAVPPEAAN